MLGITISGTAPQERSPQNDVTQDILTSLDTDREVQCLV